MPVESLDTCQQLAVRANGNEHLRVRSDGSLEDGEGARRELELFELCNLVLAKVEIIRCIFDILMIHGRWERGREKGWISRLGKNIREFVTRLGEKFPD